MTAAKNGARAPIGPIGAQSVSSEGHPRVPHAIVERARLFDQLDAADQLTIIRAPRGYGKGTLVTHWLALRMPPDAVVTWLTADRRGTSPDQLWSSITDELIRATADDRTDAERTDVRRAIRAVRKPVLLVVDACERIESAAACEHLIDLLRDCPNLQAIICGRTGPLLESANVTGIGVTSIDAVDLLFTIEETAEALLAVGLEAGAARVDAVYQVTRGWPLAVTSAAVVLANTTGSVDDPTVLSRWSHAFVRSQILSDNDDSHRFRTICELAVPARLTDETIRLTGDSTRHRRELERLQSDGIVHSEIEDGETVYRWPPLARQVLCDLLEQQEPTRARELHRRLARWYSRRQSWNHTIEHATRASEPALVIAAIENGWAQLVANNPEALEFAFASMPDEQLLRSPIATAVRTIMRPAPDADTRMPYTLPSDPESLKEIGRSDKAAGVLSTVTALMIALRARHRWTRARSLARQLETVARAAGESNSRDDKQLDELLPVVFLHIGITLQVLGEMADAVRPLTTAYETSQHGPYTGIAFHAAGSAALSESLTEHTQAARLWLERQADIPAPHTWLAQQMGTSFTISRLLLAIEELDRCAADAMMAELARVDRTTDELWAVALFARAGYALVWGGRVETLKRIVTARADPAYCADSAPLDTLLVRAETTLLIALGRPNAAKRALSAMARTTRLLYPARALLALLTGSSKEALDVAEMGIRHESSTVNAHIEMRVLQAVAHYRLDNVNEGAAILKHTVESVRGLAVRRPFASIPRRWLTDLAKRVPAARSILDDLERRDVREIFPEQLDLVALTEREHIILAKLAEHLTVEQIGRELYVSSNTVKTHMRGIYRKLGATTREEALRAAVLADLIAEPAQA